MEDTGREKDELAWAKERLNRELERVKLELSDVRGHLSTTEHDKSTALNEMKALQQLLIQAKENEVSGLLVSLSPSLSLFLSLLSPLSPPLRLSPPYVLCVT